METQRNESFSKMCTTLFRIREISGSNLSPDIGYHDCVILWFSSVPPGKYLNSISNQPRIAYFLIISNSLYCDMIEQLNNRRHPLLGDGTVNTIPRYCEIHGQIHGGETSCSVDPRSRGRLPATKAGPLLLACKQARGSSLTQTRVLSQEQDGQSE